MWKEYDDLHWYKNTYNLLYSQIHNSIIVATTEINLLINCGHILIPELIGSDRNVQKSSWRKHIIG